MYKHGEEHRSGLRPPHLPLTPVLLFRQRGECRRCNHSAPFFFFPFPLLFTFRLFPFSPFLFSPSSFPIPLPHFLLPFTSPSCLLLPPSTFASFFPPPSSFSHHPSSFPITIPLPLTSPFASSFPLPSSLPPSPIPLPPYSYPLPPPSPTHLPSVPELGRDNPKCEAYSVC